MKAITTTAYGPTATLPSRIIASDGDGNRATFKPDGGDTIGDGAHLAAAVMLRDKMGWKGDLIGGWQKRGTFVWVFSPLPPAGSARNPYQALRVAEATIQRLDRKARAPSAQGTLDVIRDAIAYAEGCKP